MLLTLPDGNILQEDNILQNIFAGDRRYPLSTIALYDHTIGNLHNAVRQIDVLSLCALNAFSFHRAADTMGNIWNQRYFIEDQIANITIEPFQVYWARMQEDQIQGQIGIISNCLENIEAAVDGLGPVGTSKLAHRLRPNIIPLYDSVINKRWFHFNQMDPWNDYLNAVFFGQNLDANFQGICNPANLNCLQNVRGQIGNHFINLSLLRIWDIVLWWVAQNGFPGQLQ